MFKKIKKKNQKYIKSYSWFNRYQAYTFEQDSRITHNHAYLYLLTIVDDLVNKGLRMQSQTKKQINYELNEVSLCNWRASNASYRKKKRIC